MGVAASIKPATNLYCGIFSELYIDSYRVLTEMTTFKKPWRRWCAEKSKWLTWN